VDRAILPPSHIEEPWNTSRYAAFAPDWQSQQRVLARRCFRFQVSRFLLIGFSLGFHRARGRLDDPDFPFAFAETLAVEVSLKSKPP
jgi:hypothetical protein